jgi:3,4-dihydroxy-9,10-secoandrosta-1,3,5(10)-triene-9,17-dione 4,5-dioxygenase
MSAASIGYVRIMSTDPAAWIRFGTDIMGLMEAARDDEQGARYLRMDDHPFRFMIEPGDSDRLLACGFEYRSRGAWRNVLDQLEAAGHPVEAGSEAEAARRCVMGYASTRDPAGNLIELYWGRKLDYVPLNSPTGVREFITGDETTGDMGFGHAVLPTPNIDEAHHFYTDLIGLGDADDLLLPPPAPDAPPMRVVFLHADNPRQHSLALFNGPHPAGVIHLMVEVGSLDEVGLAQDRAKAAGIPIITSLGRHVYDNMCSFYMLAPGGIPVEYGYDGLLVDWDNYTPTVSTEGDIWGHEYNFPAPD